MIFIYPTKLSFKMSVPDDDTFEKDYNEASSALNEPPSESILYHLVQEHLKEKDANAEKKKNADVEKVRVRAEARMLACKDFGFSRLYGSYGASFDADVASSNPAGREKDPTTECIINTHHRDIDSVFFTVGSSDISDSLESSD